MGGGEDVDDGTQSPRHETGCCAAAGIGKKGASGGWGGSRHARRRSGLAEAEFVLPGPTLTAVGLAHPPAPGVVAGFSEETAVAVAAEEVVVAVPPWTSSLALRHWL